ncbi:pantoate--beta-alanine ligase [Persicitalea jodogahamensis]|uniref:Pantothenate synthetase n=1 Tax=Persicitalea jodogahamensis TaxID=402147 RepID=A0A8J3D0H8_9BACT|nr:pantoate--beta-alanine ligase [Persicitalea jodogahamensis]GHB57840.1 pantothenate synthetase [Persicitalea jodogahamensis]
MFLVTDPYTLKEHLRKLLGTDNSLGLVPTMGALHDGHLELVKRSVHENALTVVSIFVNPLQFNNPDDLTKYPRTLDEDCAMLEAVGCDIVFAPSAEEMYANPPRLKLDFGDLERVMEGAFRPGHFNGVGIVVARLFNMVQPARAYFGQKDWQQVAVVRRLIEDLSFPIELVACPTVREADGLAMSSRNRRLSDHEREIAPLIHRTLQEAKHQLQSGISIQKVKQLVSGKFARQPEFALEYFEIADATTLQPLDALPPEGKTALCVAAQLGAVRLIDNVVF